MGGCAELNCKCILLNARVHSFISCQVRVAVRNLCGNVFCCVANTSNCQMKCRTIIMHLLCEREFDSATVFSFVKGSSTVLEYHQKIFFHRYRVCRVFSPVLWRG